MVSVQSDPGLLGTWLRGPQLAQLEGLASDCYVAVTPAAVGERRPGRIARRLQDLGLPPTWGVLLLDVIPVSSTSGDAEDQVEIRQLHKPTALQEAPVAARRRWQYQIGRTAMFRMH